MNKKVSIKNVFVFILFAVTGILSVLMFVDAYFKSKMNTQYDELTKNTLSITKTLTYLNIAQNNFSSFYQYKNKEDYDSTMYNLYEAYAYIESIHAALKPEQDILLFSRIFLQVAEGLTLHINANFLSEATDNTDFANLNILRDYFTALKNIYNQLTVSYMKYLNMQYEIMYQQYREFKNVQSIILLLLIFLPIGIFVFFTHERINYEKQLHTHILENERQRKLLFESKFRILQTQINPHFLFNTFNLIIRVIQTKENTKAAKLIKATADILRGNLESKDLIIPLEKEIQNLKAYIYIARERLAGRATITFRCSPLTDQFYIPPFTIQPLVENAIKHGLSKTVKNGKIVINFEETPQALVISVKDNGKGGEQSFFDSLIKSNSVQTERIGIYNIYQRLSMLFSRTDVLSMQAAPGKGLTVSVTLFKQNLKNKEFTLD